MRLFKSKKKKKKGKQNKGNIKEISGNQILIRVYKDFGSNTQILKAEYFALEKRDAFNNLISINPNFQHNQDTDFSIDDVYREMQIILEFKNKSKEEKIKILKERIEKQNKLIRLLEKYPKLNAMYNFCDEDLKSRDYKILKNHIEHQEGEGAYFTIENGLRVYSFLACDGYLAPIWHGIDRYTQYPDHTRKLKITVQEDMRMRQEIEEYSRNKKVINIVVWIAVITIIFFITTCAFAGWLFNQYQKMDDKIYESSYRCADLTMQLNEAYGSYIIQGILPQNNAKPEAQDKELTAKSTIS